MDLDETPDQYFGYDGRLASFQISKPVGKRKSNTKGKAAKALAWPHQHLDPDSFARAGFYFDPTPEYPDNTVCFLCSRKIGGWEDGDNPFEEHLRLSPHCGWAIVAAIETGLGDYYMDDPAQPQMVEARKATFGGRWPHEGKRGWKCKTKQLVEAGWKYTPTAESDDMATCTYCQLALDGWEQKDNPMHEHYKRSPGCQFFLLLNQYQQGPTKKTGRGKGARTSKASRLSVQSATTAASNSTLLLDHPAEHDDSVMTATSVMTQGSTKRGRTKKATTARGKKTRAKKDEVVEVLEDPPEIQEEAPQPPKPARGRKRASDAVEDSVMTTAEAPAPKKRATRGRRSNTVDTSIVDQHDVDISMTKPAPASKAKGKKGRASNTRATRKASVSSNMSVASIADADDEHLLDDEALNRQLEADLDRPLSDDENIDADSDSGRKKAPVKPKKATAKKGAAVKKQEDTQDHHSMFDPAPAEVNEDDVDAELKALEAEMDVEPAEKLQVPKKGRKAAGTRKVSKQTKKTQQKPAPVEPEPEPEAEPVPEPVDEAVDVDELAEGHEESMMSNATVLNKRTSASIDPPKKKRGRPSKASLAKAAAEAAEAARLSSVAKSSPKVAHIDFAQSAQSQQGGTPSMSPPPQVLGYPTLPSAQEEAGDEEGEEDEIQHEHEEQEQERPATPEEPAAASTSSAKQATISPSHSPQSSDAENQPPSSRPSNTTSRNSGAGARAALAPVAATTPVRSSPAKSSRGYHHQSQNSNTLSNLQSSHPWTGVDLEMVFDNLDRENKENPAASAASKYLHGDGDGIGDPITSPEKRMTVEEWIHHNASQAEQKLRLECEATVSAFEREGVRAMVALEGLVIE